MNDLTVLSACEIVSKVKSKEVTATDVCKAYLERIDRLNAKINAYVFVDQEQVLIEAKKVDDKIANQEDIGILAGLPVAIKDNISEKGKPLGCASRILGADQRPYHSPYDAFVIEQLRSEGAIFLGRTNMDEFAMGSSTETSAYGITHNPWNLEHVPGGSSGGSAAAVAARLAPVALGSDTGGSIRQPASFCGVVGLKPIYGEVSRFGLSAFASSLDQIGPFARNVRDSALVMQAMAKHDVQDSTSINSKDLYGKYLDFAEPGVEGMKIGVPSFAWNDAVDEEVKESLRQAQSVLEEMGASVEAVELPYSQYAVAVYYIIATAEASSNLARYDGVQYGVRSSDVDQLSEMYIQTREQGFGDEVKRRILLGTYVLSSGYYDAYYKKAQKVRTLIKKDYENLFDGQGFDALMLPTSPTPSFPIGSKTSDPLQMYLSDIFTISVNLAGLPAISLPSGLNQKGLPLSVQLVSAARPSEGLRSLFRVASSFEKGANVDMNCPIE